MKNYLTKEGHPVKTNCPQPDWIEVSDKEYSDKCTEMNAKSETDKKKSEDDILPTIEQDKRIAKFLREYALKELKEDDLRPIKIVSEKINLLK